LARAGTGQGQDVADFDITALIRTEHEAFRRAFSEIEQLTESDELGRRWREVADQLEVHAAGEEEVFYPELLREVDGSEGETQHAVKDHNEIRETTGKVDEHEVGSESWWVAFREAREATVEHLGEEEEDVLPPFQAEVSQEKSSELGMRWMKFLEEHKSAQGLSGELKDPVAYVEEHTG